MASPSLFNHSFSFRMCAPGEHILLPWESSKCNAMPHPHTSAKPPLASLHSTPWSSPGIHFTSEREKRVFQAGFSKQTPAELLNKHKPNCSPSVSTCARSGLHQLTAAHFSDTSAVSGLWELQLPRMKVYSRGGDGQPAAGEERSPLLPLIWHPFAQHLLPWAPLNTLRGTEERHHVPWLSSAASDQSQALHPGSTGW